MNIVQEIHTAFRSAGDKLLAECKELLNNRKAKVDHAVYFANRFKNIGFGKAKPVKHLQELENKGMKANEIIEAIEYYAVYYPNHKFIIEEDVKKLCEKYGLLMGEADNYIGDIPEKNLAEIEAFKLRKEDYQEVALFGDWRTTPVGLQLLGQQYFGSRTRRGRIIDLTALEEEAHKAQLTSEYDVAKRELEIWLRKQQYPLSPQEAFIHSAFNEVSLNDQLKKIEELEVNKKKAPFKICAPHADFDMKGYEVREGYKIVYDPIVLQPVRFKTNRAGEICGHLIVTAWGDEASDEIVVNQAKN